MDLLNCWSWKINVEGGGGTELQYASTVRTRTHSSQHSVIIVIFTPVAAEFQSQLSAQNCI